MSYLEILLILVIIGFGAWVLYLLKIKRVVDNGKKQMSELVKQQAEKKSENKQKILDYLDGKDKIANNDVEKLLGVSNATAERYLDELEKEGVLRQEGKIGRDVFYSKTR